METVKSTLKKLISDYSSVIVITAGSIWITKRVATAVITHFHTQQMLEKWKDTPKDTVVLHMIGREKKAPSNSPFVIKLETYLRMANIPYQVDFSYPWSSVGKTPWITLNGEHIADSQIIMEHIARQSPTECLLEKIQPVIPLETATFDKLHSYSLFEGLHNYFVTNFCYSDNVVKLRKYSVTLDHYSPEQKAVARAVRIMMDEHFYWGLALWRYVYSEGKGFDEINSMSPKAQRIFYRVANKRVKDNAWSQGTGRHSQETVIKMMKDNLRAVSLIIGTNKFLLGDDPCEEDCSVFGFLCQVLWCAPGSPYLKLMTDELPNLQEYCIRMKETFWPDWEKCLAGAPAVLNSQIIN